MGRYAIIDKETGEILEEDVLLIGKRPYKVDKGYVKVFITFLKDIVDNPKIAGKSIRLLFYMIEECMDYESLRITIIPKYAIETLNISDRTYRNWIKDLIEVGILKKVDNFTYYLKPYTFIKGNMSKAIEKGLKNNKNKKRGETASAPKIDLDPSTFEEIFTTPNPKKEANDEQKA